MTPDRTPPDASEGPISLKAGSLTSNDPCDPSSISAKESTIKGGNRLARQGKIDEALAVYRRIIVVSRREIAEGRSLLAVDRLEQAVRRIGDLAPKFLSAGNFQCALDCADEALVQYKKGTTLHIVRAHALMGLDRADEAREVYLRYLGKGLSGGKSCDTLILRGFAEFRRLGCRYPLMKEIRQLVAASKPRKQPAADAIPPSVPINPSVATAPSPPVARLLPEIERGDRLFGSNRFGDALESYRRGVAICKAAPAPDGRDSPAPRDFDLAVAGIGRVAFALLLDRQANPALDAIQEALTYRPNWVWLHLIHAHALMLTGQISPARTAHREYRDRSLEGGVPWLTAIHHDFARLRDAGYNLPIMSRFERDFPLKV